MVGSDIVGRIEKLGAEIDGLSLGDRVIVAPGFPSDPTEWDVTPENEAPSYFPTGTYGWGGYAQYMEVPTRWVIRDETNLAAEDLATMPLVLVTAVHAVKNFSGELVEEAVCWSRLAPPVVAAWRSKSPKPLAPTSSRP